MIPGSEPPSKALYRLNQIELVKIKKQLSELLAMGYIRTTKSSYGAPVLFAKKNDGKLRLCVDYKAFNKMTVRNNYQLPRTDDLFDCLASEKYFSRIDLKSGYYQIWIADHNIEKTTCRTRYGSFEFVVIPFGLCNAPSTFTMLMNIIFREYMGEYVIVYIDDIFIYSDLLETHFENLWQMFKKLIQHQLYRNIDKSEFELEHIGFLDHLVSSYGIRPDMQKVEIIEN